MSVLVLLDSPIADAICNFLALVVLPIIIFVLYLYRRRQIKIMKIQQNRFASLLVELDRKNERLAEENGKLKKQVEKNKKIITELKKLTQSKD